MTDKQKYWIRDVEGVYAQVEGADARDWWIKVNGWSEAAEPGPTDQVHVVNEHPEVGPARLPYGVIEDLAGLGWAAGPPSAAAGIPAPADLPAAEPVKPTKTPAAAGGEQKEK